MIVRAKGSSAYDVIAGNSGGGGMTPEEKDKFNELVDKSVISPDNSVKHLVELSMEEFQTYIDENKLEPETDYLIRDGGGIAATSSTPVGSGILWFGKSDKIPTNYILPEGQLLQIKQYPTLFDKFSTTYGGDGIMTFGVPNIKGKIVVHLDTSQTEFNTLGKTGGDKNLQQHKHSMVTGENAGVPMFYRADRTDGGGTGGAPNLTGFEVAAGTAGECLGWSAASSGNNMNLNVTEPQDTQNAGVGTSQNIQPYITAYYIIKAREEAYTEDLYSLDKDVQQFKNNEVSLWVNPNPTLAFAPQVISLKDSINNYVRYQVIYKYFKGDNHFIETTMPSKYTHIKLLGLIDYMTERRCNFQNNGLDCNIEQCVKSSAFGSSGTADNDRNVPIEIIGIKY